MRIKYSILRLQKDLKDVALEAGGDFKTGAEVTITNTADETGDIWKNLQSIVLTRPDGTKRHFLRMDRRAFSKRSDIRSMEQACYSEKISLKRLASTVWRSRRSIMAWRRLSLRSQKKRKKKGDDDGRLKEAPTVGSDTDYFFGSYTIAVGMGNDDWMKAITGVTVNGETYEKGYYRDNTYSLSTTDGKISLDKAGFTKTRMLL